MKLRGKNFDKSLVALIKHIDDEYVLKKLNLTEMIYMNWLEIYDMMKELYDISVLFKMFKRI